jgi:hypothetical protein
MKTAKLRRVAMLSALALIFLMATVPFEARAQSSAVDPAATKILLRMADYLGKLQKFSVHTQNTLEDELESGHRVDFEVSATVAVSRPNRLHAVRKGDLIDQSFFYDGQSLTLYNAAEKVYATESAPGTLEEMFEFARESLGLIVPVADLVYRYAYPLLMQDVDLAVVVGKSVIGGVTCDHLLFSRPGVDFQVWVAESGPPLPYKYTITDTGSCARLSISTVMSDWEVKPSLDNARFTFVPPKGARSISFMPFKAF